jgi:hypothetical protein
VQQTAAGVSEQGESRRFGQTRISNRRYKDYELYVTVEEEELMLATVEENPAAVAHIMDHYEEKEGIKKKRKKYKHKSGQNQLDAGIKQYGE